MHLYAQYTIVFFGDSIDDLKAVTVSVTVLFTGFIFSIRDSQVILIAGVLTFNKQKVSLGMEIQSDNPLPLRDFLTPFYCIFQR